MNGYTSKTVIVVVVFVVAVLYQEKCICRNNNNNNNNNNTILSILYPFKIIIYPYGQSGYKSLILLNHVIIHIKKAFYAML